MADASKTNRARIFGQWGALKILHPQIAPALNEIEELSSTNPQQAKEKWTSLIESSPTLPESLFHNLQWAAFEEGQTTEEKNEEQESTEEHEAHKRHLLHPESTLDTEEDKVYEDANLDPAVEKAEEEILRKANADPLVRQTTSRADFKEYQKAWDEAYSHHDEAAWDDFINQHPQKAGVYAGNHEGIKAALERKRVAQAPQKTGKLRVARDIIAPQIPLGSFVKRRVVDNKTVQKISKTAANTLFPQAFLFRKGKEKTSPVVSKLFKNKTVNKVGSIGSNVLFPHRFLFRKGKNAAIRLSKPLAKPARIASNILLPQKFVFRPAKRAAKAVASKTAMPVARALFPHYFLGRGLGKKLFRRGRGGSGKSSDRPSSGVGQALGPGADIAKQAAQQLAQKAAVALFSNPVAWIVLGVILLILIIVYIIMSIAGGGGSIEGPTETDTNVTCQNPPVSSVTPLPGVTLTLSGPESVQSGEDIPYSLSVLYDESVATTPREKVVVYDFIPTNTTFVSASGTHEKRGNAILWELSKNQENSFNLVLKPTTTNICIVNVFSATNNPDRHKLDDDVIPTDPSDYQATIKSEFGIQMEGFTPDSLKWAYDTLKSVSSTKFVNLQKGHITKIFAKQYSTSDWESDAFAPGSDTDGCPAVIELVQGWPAPDGEEIFKITLIHEISHVIDRCAPETEALGRNSHGIPGAFLEVYPKEGGATYYGQHASGTPNPAISGPNMTPDQNCPAGNPISEDYADMLAYYLFPTSRQKNVCKTTRLPNPYEGGAHPLHKALAERILKR